MRGRLKSTVGQPAVRAATCWTEGQVQELGNDWMPDSEPVALTGRGVAKAAKATRAAKGTRAAKATKAVKRPAKKRAPKPA